MRDEGRHELVPVLERSAARYAAAARHLEALPRGLLGALGAHASWTSAATHALLPLLVSDAAIAVQLETGIGSHRRRFRGWRGGLWLPECGYAPWLAQPLAKAGVRAACVELPGYAGEALFEPALTDEGVVLWPLDREVISLVWSARGYPSRAPYRDSHRLTPSHHGGDLRTWSGPAVAELAWRARAAEVKVLAAGRPPPRAVRELLALQASDWIFLTHQGLAGDYPRERLAAHFIALERALAGEAGMSAELRNLAPDLAPWPG